MAKVDEAVAVAKVAKKAASTLFAGRAAFGGAKVAAVLLTGLTGGAGYLGYQFVNTPGADLSSPSGATDADKKPALIPSDFAADRPARLLGGSESAPAPWSSSKETAPATAPTENPWAKPSGSLVDDGAKPAAPPADFNRRTFAPEKTAQVDTGAAGSTAAPRWGADTKPSLPNDVGSTPSRFPISPAPIAPLSPSPQFSNNRSTTNGNSTSGNSLRSTSPSLPSSGNALDSRTKPLATTPTTTAIQAGQRMMRCINPCCPNVVMCVPVNPCCPTQATTKTPTEAKPAGSPLKLSRAGKSGPQPTLASLTSPVRVAAYEAAAQPATELVLPEDSYWTIAERVYGDGEYYRALQEFHLRRGVRKLEIGDELTIPSVAGLRRDYASLCPAEHESREPQGIPLANVSRTNLRQLYVVTDGDTLRSIADRELRDANRAGELADLNRAILDKAGYLRTGLELFLPPR